MTTIRIYSSDSVNTYADNQGQDISEEFWSFFGTSDKPATLLVDVAVESADTIAINQTILLTNASPGQFPHSALSVTITEGLDFRDQEDDRTFTTGETITQACSNRDVVGGLNWYRPHYTEIFDDHISESGATLIPTAGALSTALWAKNFGFNIPLNATIQGFIIRALRDITGGAAVTADQGNILMCKWWPMAETFQQKIFPITAWPPAEPSVFNQQIALDYDGNVLACGGGITTGGDENVHTYTRSGSTWSNDVELTGTGIVNGHAYPDAIFLSTDGTRFATSAEKDISAVCVTEWLDLYF